MSTLVARGEIAHHGAQFLLGLAGCAATSRCLVDRALLLGACGSRTSGPRRRCAGRSSRSCAITASSASHHISPTRSGKLGRDIDRERHLVFLQDRIGEFQLVAIAVVEGDADEAPARNRARSCGDASRRARRDRCRERRRRRITRSKNAGVTSSSRLGWKRSGARRPHVMQRQDRADAAEQRSQQQRARR